MKALTTSLSAAALATLSAAAAAQISSHADHHAAEDAMMNTPKSIAAEHRELHIVLERATKEPGAVGATARKLEAALSPHFRREEEIATPPLGLLQRLATGEVTPEMTAVLPLTEALERELPQMLREHQAIRAAVTEFRAAAVTAGRTDYVRFSDELAAHAREEEEVLYPAAVLVGRYVARTAPAKK